MNTELLRLTVRPIAPLNHSSVVAALSGSLRVLTEDTVHDAREGLENGDATDWLAACFGGRTGMQ
jgi:hypothetical protein